MTLRNRGSITFQSGAALRHGPIQRSSSSTGQDSTSIRRRFLTLAQGLAIVGVLLLFAGLFLRSCTDPFYSGGFYGFCYNSPYAGDWVFLVEFALVLILIAVVLRALYQPEPLPPLPSVSASWATGSDSKPTGLRHSSTFSAIEPDVTGIRLNCRNCGEYFDATLPRCDNCGSVVK